MRFCGYEAFWALFWINWMLMVDSRYDCGLWLHFIHIFHTNRGNTVLLNTITLLI